MTTPCFGILLAGGAAARMGGGDKALIRVGGATLLARAIAATAAQCAGLVLNANGDPGRFAGFGLPVVEDATPDLKGPLAGILAGLDWIAAHRPSCALALSVSTDAPFLPPDLAAKLYAARGAAGADIACARSGGAAHRVIALWPVALRADLRRALFDEDMRKVERFMQRWRVAYADWSIDPFDPFFNANTPADIARAEMIAAARGICRTEPGPFGA